MERYQRLAKVKQSCRLQSSNKTVQRRRVPLTFYGNLQALESRRSVEVKGRWIRCWGFQCCGLSVWDTWSFIVSRAVALSGASCIWLINFDSAITLVKSPFLSPPNPTPSNCIDLIGPNFIFPGSAFTSSLEIGGLLGGILAGYITDKMARQATSVRCYLSCINIGYSKQGPPKTL